jgi:hypothetical protein
MLSRTRRCCLRRKAKFPLDSHRQSPLEDFETLSLKPDLIALNMHNLLISLKKISHRTPPRKTGRQKPPAAALNITEQIRKTFRASN